MRTTRRRGVLLLEVVIAALLLGIMLVPMIGLSSRNDQEHDVLVEQALAQGLALDTIERFKRYKPHWPLPGQVDHASGFEGPPVYEMYGPAELRPGRETLFDRVLIDRVRTLGMSLRPTIERRRDPENGALFELTVTIDWTSRSGVERSVTYARMCYTP